jgi:hypothetical protein
MTGLLAVSGQASYDDVKVKTNDPAFLPAQGGNLVAAHDALIDARGSTLTLSDIEPLATAVFSEWTQALGAGDPRLAGMVDVRIRIADLAGGALGHYEAGELTLDADAAGHGWFVDLTPADSTEFSVEYQRSTLRATEDSEAFGRMDLLTVLMHEMGHAIGFKDGETRYAVMHEELDPGVRFLLDDAPRAAQRLPQEPSFDFDLAAGQGAMRAGVDWSSGGGWTSGYTPYAAPEPGAGSNFTDYLVKLFKRPNTETGYDSLGKSLIGKEGATGAKKS